MIKLFKTVPAGAFSPTDVSDMACWYKHDAGITTATESTAWVADTITAIGTIRVPTSANGCSYICTSRSGDYKTHATTEPSWPTTVWDTVVDDQVTWTCMPTTTYCSAWADQSGCGIDMAQTSSTNRFCYHTDGLYGCYALTSRYLSTTDVNLLKNVAGGSMFAVVWVPSAVPGTCYVCRVSSGDAYTDCRMGIALNTSELVVMRTATLDADTSGTGTGINAASEGWHILSLTADYAGDGQAKAYLDGALEVTDDDIGTVGNTSDTNCHTFWIGYTTTGQFWNGKIKEIIIYNKKVSDAERGNIHTYLATRHGITI